MLDSPYAALATSCLSLECPFKGLSCAGARRSEFREARKPAFDDTFPQASSLWRSVKTCAQEWRPIARLEPIRKE
jgi:hypothetical protein